MISAARIFVVSTHSISCNVISVTIVYGCYIYCLYTACTGESTDKIGILKNR